MRQITIKQSGETVYYLSPDGFQKGVIKKSQVLSDKFVALEINYYVIDDINAEFMGYKKSPEEVWDSYDDMLSHFKSKPL